MLLGTKDYIPLNESDFMIKLLPYEPTTTRLDGFEESIEQGSATVRRQRPTNVTEFAAGPPS